MDSRLFDDENKTGLAWVLDFVFRLAVVLMVFAALGLVVGLVEGCDGGQPATSTSPACKLDPAQSFAESRSLPVRTTEDGITVAYCSHLGQAITDCTVSVNGQLLFCAIQECPGTWTTTPCGWSDEHGRPAATCARAAGASISGCVTAGSACVPTCG